MSGEEGDPGAGNTVLLRAVFQKLEEMQAEQKRQGSKLEEVQVQLDQVHAGQQSQDGKLNDLGRFFQDVNDHLVGLEHRLDNLEQRFDALNNMVVDQVRQTQRVMRQLSELREDMELAIKAELSGRIGMLQTELGHRFDELTARIDRLEGTDPWSARPGPRPAPGPQP